MLLNTGGTSEYLPEVLKFLCLEPGYKFMTDQYGFEDVWKED
ncbi:immunity protein Imm33 domain-containing protein [Chromobacterium violaceum]